MRERLRQLPKKWRLDDSYEEAVAQIVKDTYPEGLIHLAPPGEAERQKVVSWFLREGLGQGAAGNKAATYLLISSPTPNEAPRATPKAGQAEGASAPRPRMPAPSRKGEGAKSSDETAKGGDVRSDASGRKGPDAFPLNVNVQIHISADVGTEQIESIFQAMRRYLYDAPAA